MQTTNFENGAVSETDYLRSIPVTHVEIAGSTTARTYQVYARCGWINTACATHINNRNSNDMATFSHMIIYEIAQ